MAADRPVRIQTARPEDAGRIREVVRAAYARWVPIIGREPIPMNADYARAVEEHRIETLLAGDEMVGLIETMLRPDHLWIENLAVRPDQQGKGLGRRLLLRAEEQASEAGSPEIRLLTNAAFAANIALYERVGYVVFERDALMGGTVYMSKAIGPR